MQNNNDGIEYENTKNLYIGLIMKLVESYLSHIDVKKLSEKEYKKTYSEYVDKTILTATQIFKIELMNKKFGKNNENY